MALKAKEFRITFTNKGFVLCNSYEQREGGVYWKRDRTEGYSANDLIKSIQEIRNGKPV